MDQWRNQTDDLLKDMEERLTQIYTEAQEEIATKWYEYMKDAEKRLAPYEKAYQEAKESGDKQAIDNFGFALGREKQKVALQNKYYDGMMNYTTKQLTHVNEVAVSYINGQMPKVYGINYNGTLQDIQTDAEKIGNIGVSFNLVDERTIRNLVKTNRLYLPFKEIDETKDMAWNKKAINSQILQGILQGESIPKIAGRLQNVTNMNEAAAIRNARTMTTAAENGGRFDAMKEADEKGIVYEKQWLATADDRTRETHAAIDGESVPLDDTFSNDLEYPGDPMGEASEVYNCRCTMVRNLIGFRKADGSVETVADEEYENPFSLPETRQEREERLQREAEEAAAAERARQEEEERNKRVFVFEPASTKEEAEAFINNYVDSKKFGALGVDYTGVNIDTANRINKTLAELQEKYNVEPFGGIKAPAGNTKEGKMIAGSTAAYSPVRDSFYLNRNIFKTAEGADKALLKEAEAVKDIYLHPEKYDLSKMSRAGRIVIENGRTSGRATVPETLEQVIYHEYGHRLEKYMDKEDVMFIKDRMGDYSINISGYACQDVSEYIAESFCCYNSGQENLVDPELKQIFEKLER